MNHIYCCLCLWQRVHLSSTDFIYNATSFELKMSFNVLCFVYKIRLTIFSFFLPLSVITQVINLLNRIWRHHLISNKVCQNSCPLILDNNHSKFSVFCVRFMYKYSALFYFFLFNRTPFVFFKDISCCTYSYPLQRSPFAYFYKSLHWRLLEAEIGLRRWF